MLSTKKDLHFFLAAIPISIVLHLLFSKYGMHFADDGILLTATKRIFYHGEIPHLDFSHLRPLGTTILWALPVLLFKDSLILVSHYLVQLQYTLIAICWFLCLRKAFQPKLGLVTEWSILLVTVILTMSSHWIFPLYTTDGIFWCSLGFYCLQFREQATIKCIGYLLIGMAGLAKQNFFGFVPIALFSQGDWRYIKYWISSSVPAIIYLSLITYFGALENFIFQMGIYKFSSTFYNHGIDALFFTKPSFRGFLFGLLSGLSMRKLEGNTSAKNSIKYLPMILLGGAISYSVISFYQDRFFPRIQIFLFTLIVGMAIPQIQKTWKFPEIIKIGIPLFFLSWFSSFSLSFHYPHAMAGACFTYLLLTFHKNFTIFRFASPVKVKLASIIICLAFAGAFYQLRRKYTYNMLTTTESPHSIQGIYPGANGMLVGRDMFEVMSEAKALADQYASKGKRILILPDFTSYWAGVDAPPPLPIIWLQYMEIAHPRLLKEINDSIVSIKEEYAILLAKYDGRILTRGKRFAGSVALPEGNVRRVYDVIKRNYRQVDSQGKFFDVYSN